MAQLPKVPLDLPVFATSGQSWIITKISVGLPGCGTSGQAMPDREGLEQFELAKGLAYLWLQQVRSMKKPVAEGILPVMSNSGQAHGQGSQDLVFSSFQGRRVPRKVQLLGKAQRPVEDQVGKASGEGRRQVLGKGQRLGEHKFSENPGSGEVRRLGKACS